MKLTKNHDIKILVVDDDQLVLEAISLLVELFGYKCYTAVNGLDAIEKLKSDVIDIVVTDVDMPEMDGLKLLSYIKDNYTDTDVIVATGYTDKASYADVIRAGAIDFIKKPFERDELEAKLNRAERERNMIRRLEKLSLCDSLTGLYNRRSFDLRLAEEVQRAHRQDFQVYLALIDIDNFKGYNDTFGHPAGDKVLNAVGMILNDCTRHNVDFTFRYGGDEFAAILTQIGEEQAVKIMERVLHNFQQAGFSGTTLSVGLVRCTRDETLSWPANVARMIDRADKALYLAKAQGKNMVVLDSGS
ncbi:MAG: diguanylate cyclase [Deltaproteobacteria bacterium]|nr:diguanylate cyclase [Deltaproteobacteria bacterium]